MRKARVALIGSFFLAALLAGLPAPASGQNREKFVISARAGGVNAVTGRATVRGRGATEWQPLMITEDLERGDVVKTGPDGRVEVLLNPGSFLRIAENSEFEMSDNSLENLEVRLIRGTAIMEVTGADDSELLINVTTPHTRMAIVRRGLYRVNVVPDDATELIVRKGRVMLEGSHTKIKGGNKVVFNGGQTYSIAKLNQVDKKRVDTFEGWSKDRAETVAKANRSIKRRDMALLMAGLRDPWNRGLRSMGMWVFSPRSGCYTFLPLYSGWGSPYGGSYSSAFYGGFYYGNLCCGQRPYPTGGTTTGSSPSGGTSPGGSPAGGSHFPTLPRSSADYPAKSEGERFRDRMP